MLECVIIQFMLGYNPTTKEDKLLYRCEGEKVFRYLKPTRESIDIATGTYSIEGNYIILEENYGL